MIGGVESCSMVDKDLKKGVIHCGTSYFKMQSNPIHNVLKIL